MIGYVVTLMNLHASKEIAYRCKESAADVGIRVELFPAVDKNSSLEELANEGLEIASQEVKDQFLQGADSKYSNQNAVLGNFVSQYRIWNKILNNNQPGIVLEHDAVFLAPLPNLEGKGHIINIGIPSFGAFKKQTTPGVYPMFSKPGGYIPGAHGYYVTPAGAEQLIHAAKTYGAGPCDLFLNNKMFPDIKEIWPQIVEARDTFTTIQNQEGCVAKHSYKKNQKGYAILTNN